MLEFHCVKNTQQVGHLRLCLDYSTYEFNSNYFFRLALCFFQTVYYYSASLARATPLARPASLHYNKPISLV